MTIERVGIVGGGLMGSGIAELCARSGCDVVVREVDKDTVEAARERIERSMRRAFEGHELSEENFHLSLERVRVTEDYEELEDRQLVIETIIESAEEKLEKFP